jgi:hypothetical protein
MSIPQLTSATVPPSPAVASGGEEATPDPVSVPLALPLAGTPPEPPLAEAPLDPPVAATPLDPPLAEAPLAPPLAGAPPGPVPLLVHPAPKQAAASTKDMA